MKLKEIFDQLTYGELSQISWGGGEQGVLDDANWDRALAHINLGLVALYKRFALKESTVEVPLVANQTAYSLAVLAPDLLKIERVYTDADIELELNNRANSYSLITPSTTVLQVPKAMVDGSTELPEALQTALLKVAYRASHPQIVQGYYIDPELVDVELPYSHLQALLYFVASRVNNPIGMSNEFHAGNSYAAKYEMECQRLDTENLQIDQGSQSDRLVRNGWA